MKAAKVPSVREAWMILPVLHILNVLSKIYRHTVWKSCFFQVFLINARFFSKFISMSQFSVCCALNAQTCLH